MLDKSLHSLRDKYCISLVRVINVAVIEDTLIILAFLEILEVVWSPWIYDVVSDHNCPLCNNSLFLQPL